MTSRLMRAVAPATSATSRGGTPTALASSRTSAAFASPSLGGAATRTLRTARSSASRSMPSMASRPPLGVSRTASATPPAIADHGRGPPKLENVRVDVPNDHIFQQQNEQDQDHRRHVDAAEIRHYRADRPQQRLGEPVQEVEQHRHHLIAGVDHIEGDQPGQNGGSDQHPDVDLQHQQNDIEDRTHENPPVRGERKLAGRMAWNKPTGG